MKLWEVLKALDENPWKVFESDRRILQADENRIFFQRKHDSRELFAYERIASDWQEVKQPVTWQEAIQAWAEGKKVVWEEDAERRVFDRNRIWVISKYQNHLLDQDGDAVTVRMISGGKWYVED